MEDASHRLYCRSGDRHSINNHNKKDMAKSVLDGTNLILSVGEKALGFSTGCKVTTTTETGERVTKEAASGKWKEKFVKSFSESISAGNYSAIGA